jgi:gamma-glutamylcyclotransferase (GGCT)/AIG2-like uncharacterized protein YtfP
VLFFTRRIEAKSVTKTAGCGKHPSRVSSAMIHTIFVYGTLRQNASNAWRMNGARYLGDGQVAAKLYRISWYPALRLDPSHANWVQGSLYEMDDALLAELDAFEGEEYQRVTVEVKTTAGEVTAMLWEYKTAPDEQALIAGGDWLKHLSENP